MVLMKTTSLVEAKAHLSKLVDDAEHRGKRILILRHGKPAAAIVPLSVAMPEREVPNFGAVLDRMAMMDTGDNRSAVDDLRAGRDREPAPPAPIDLARPPQSRVGSDAVRRPTAVRSK
jgi:prevent-host-death family protein